MKRYSSLFILAVIVYFWSGYQMFAQTEKTRKLIEVTAKPISSSSGETSNVLHKAPISDHEVPPPPEFGGAKTKGILCEVKFENRCGYVVEVYIDGYYKGTIDAWGYAWYRNISGYKAVYCMTVGRTYEWSAKGDCDGNYTFKLNKESSEK